ncbi:hypothetical protein CAS74_000230 [Pichia kudriavzevii]|uniref:Glycerophosphocholine acyltransferase 1 n=2 Tax=Pichia kudriavzevii TaxID=4909 RepID=A0A099P840_PICKU|nr:uncharacterized protein C5L36_0C02250 [Pichia kudriavzevii]AWU76281.1 hypothetical protein C5L36_0C02250 [Pichia kudriavzevii]KGK40379.1 hypothetical protein JL09_g491 [Pichia kudriavzevii]OUT23859.1 hypothetical protein CAS74_000230 [Pichia kudriavzevii]
MDIDNMEKDNGCSCTPTSDESSSNAYADLSSSDAPFFEGVTLLDLLQPTTLNLELRKKKDDTYKWVRKVYNDKKKSANINLSKEDLKEIKRFLHIKLDQVYLKVNETEKASSTEKLFFSFSVYMIFFIGYLIGHSPEYIHILYSVMFAILMPIRLLTYYKRDYGYFLADLCYYVNYLLLIYIWILPDSQSLYIACCSFSWGSLSFAVITWKNKLVLHSIEKITSTFIHVLPSVTMYVITHQLSHEYKLERFSGSVKLQQWDIMYGILQTSLLYLIWQLGYHYFITIRKADKIKKGKVTSFEYLRKSMNTHKFVRFINSLPDPLPLVAFTLIQYGYQLITMSLCPLLYKHRHLCSAFVSFIFFYATYNGATYYIDYYGKKFQRQVSELQREIEAMQQDIEERDKSGLSKVATGIES